MCMKDQHTFRCSKFALQNLLAKGNAYLHYFSSAWLGLNYRSLMLCYTADFILPQCHWQFNDFFKMIHHIKSDIVSLDTQMRPYGLRQSAAPSMNEWSRTFKWTSIPHDAEWTEPAHNDESIKFIQVLDHLKLIPCMILRELLLWNWDCHSPVHCCIGGNT